MTVTVTSFNDAPVVVNNDPFYETAEETLLNVDLTLTTTDVDHDLADLTYTLVGDGPENGVIINNNDGTATYTPNQDFVGDNTFTYSVSDGDLSSETATITITVIGGEDAPVLTSPTEFSFDEDEEDEAERTIAVTATDIDQDDLAFSCSSSANITCVVNETEDGSGANVVLSTPQDWNGAETITITVTDVVNRGRGNDFEDVLVTVNPINDIPVVADMPDETTNEDVNLDIVLQGSDVDGDPLTYEIVADPVAEAGIITNNDDGTVTYTPAEDFSGELTFTYRANDGTEYSADPPATVTINVTDTNDPPVANDIFKVMNEGESITFDLLGTDVDGDPLTYEIVAPGPLDGEVVINEDGITATYTPDENHYGNEVFTYTANDGEFYSDPGEISIAIIPVNDPPLLDNIAHVTFNEDESIEITVSATDPEGDAITYGCTGLTNLQCVVDGDKITFSNFTEHYNQQFDSHLGLGFEIATITAVDANGIGGTDYEDSHQNIIVVAIPVNDDLTANEINLQTPEETVVTVDLYEHIINVDDIGEYIESVTYTLGNTSPTNGECTINGSILTYTPNDNFPDNNNASGNDVCSYRVLDNIYVSDDALVNIEVTPVNDAPITESSDATIDEDATADDVDNPAAVFDLSTLTTDADNDPLTYSILAAGSNGTCTLDGTIVTYVPNADYPDKNDPAEGENVDTCTFQANDGTAGDTADSNISTLTITVNPINDSPVTIDSEQIIHEGEIAIFDLLGLTTDVDQTDTFTFTLVDDAANGVCVIVDGTLTYTPNENYPNIDQLPGINTCTFYATDNMGEDNSDSNVSTLTITVEPINDAPVTENSEATINEDATVDDVDNPAPTFDLSTLTTDVDNDPLTYLLLTTGDNGTCTLDEDTGTIVTYVPNADYPHTNDASGVDTCTFQANDGTGEETADSNISTLTITVDPINDAPVTIDSEQTIDEDTVAIFDLNALTTDVDLTDTFTFALVDDAINGECVIVDGTLTYTPNENYPDTNDAPGVNTCTFYAIDNIGLDNSDNVSTLTITVDPVNDIPILDEPLTDCVGTDFCDMQVNDIEFFEDESATITVSATDADGDPLIYSCINDDHPEILCDITDNEIVISSVPNYYNTGSEYITIVVDDGQEGQDTQDVLVHVVLVNDDPVLLEIDPQEFFEDESVEFDIQATDGDPEDQLTFSCQNSDNVFCVVQDSGPFQNNPEQTPIQSSVVVTANQDFNGTEEIVVSVSDGHERILISLNVPITIVPVNDPPVTVDGEQIIDEDTTADFDLTTLTTDVDNDVLTDLTYTVVEQPLQGSCSIGEDGITLTYTPSPDYPFTNDPPPGEEICSFQASDNSLFTPDSNVSTLTITVNPINDAPVTVGSDQTINEDTVATFDLNTLTTDVDQTDTFTFTLVDNAINGTCVIENEILTYTPNQDYPGTNDDSGTDSCSFYATDNMNVETSDSNTSDLIITILPVNDPPVLDEPLTDCLESDFCDIDVNDVEFLEDESVTITVSATDADGDPITYLCNNDQHPDVLCSIDGDQLTISGSSNYYNDEGFDDEQPVFITVIADDGYEDGQDSKPIYVHVIPLNDPPVLSEIDEQQFLEDSTLEFEVSAFDPDPGDLLTFTCTGSDNILCDSIDAPQNSNAVDDIFSNLILTASPNFYGTETITVTVSDGDDEDSYTDTQPVVVTVIGVNDIPKIKPLSYTVDAQESLFENIDINSVTFDEGQEFTILFEVSEPDSLDSPDELLIAYENFGFVDPQSSNQNMNFDVCSFDTVDECSFIANSDNVDETDSNNRYRCTLLCHQNFNASFFGDFKVDDQMTEYDENDEAFNGMVAQLELNIKQINDLVNPIVLNENISMYWDDIPIEDLQGSISINSDIYLDQTKFFNNTTLKTPSVIPEVFNMNDIYSYRTDITQVEPSFYFIWNRDEFPYQTDVDTDPTLNEVPYDLFYRLELVENDNVYVIKDNIEDASFTGDYAYALAVLHPDSLYSHYANGDLYIPGEHIASISDLPEDNKSNLLNYNGDEYVWRVVAQNYRVEYSYDEAACDGENERWLEGDNGQYCAEFEDESVISVNQSNPINIDIKHTEGEFHYTINPLYVDYYDMYFVPDDQCALNQFGYENEAYVNYIIDAASYTIDETESINLLEDIDGSSYDLGTDILHANGTLDFFGGEDPYITLHTLVITVDQHQNAYVNIGSFVYAEITPGEVTVMSSPSNNISVEFDSDTFDSGRTTIIMYETPYNLTDQLLKSDYRIVSDYLNIKSNNFNLNSDFSIYFNQNSIIGDYYDLEKIKVSKDDEQIITFPSYLEDDYITAKVNQFGKYMLTYNVNPASDDIAIPQTFGIKSCYPNPFNPSVSIDYSLEKDSNVRVSIYNILGQKIKEIENSYKVAGSYTSIWNGLNNQGSQMPSGVYIVEVNNKEEKSIKFVTLLK